MADGGGRRWWQTAVADGGGRCHDWGSTFDLVLLVDGQNVPAIQGVRDDYREPKNQKETFYAEFKEGAQKAVESVFEILFKRLEMLKKPYRFWYKNHMATIIFSAVPCTI